MQAAQTSIDAIKAFDAKALCPAWQHIGDFKQVDAYTYNGAIAVDAAEGIWYYDGATWEDVSGALAHVSMGQDGSMWGSNNAHNIYVRKSPASVDPWVWVAGVMDQVDAYSVDLAVGSDTAGGIFAYNGKEWDPLTGVAGQTCLHISIGIDQSLWMTTNTQEVYRKRTVFGADVWTKVDGELVYVDALNYDGAVGTDKATGIWAWNANTSADAK